MAEENTASARETCLKKMADRTECLMRDYGVSQGEAISIFIVERLEIADAKISRILSKLDKATILNEHGIPTTKPGG